MELNFVKYAVEIPQVLFHNPFYYWDSLEPSQKLNIELFLEIVNRLFNYFQKKTLS